MSNNDIKLNLRYNYERQSTTIQALPTNTINEIIGELIKILNLENLRPENIDFVGLIEDRYYPVVLDNKDLALEELHINDSCTLCFQSKDEQSNLFTVCHSETSNRLDFKWDSNRTKLGDLLEYVIEFFSLESIPRERIHLFQGLTELNVASDYDKLLKDLSMNHLTSCNVGIIPPITAEQKVSTSQLLKLKLIYENYFNKIKKTIVYPLSINMKVNDLIEQLPKFFNMKELKSEDIQFVGYGLYSAHYRISKSDQTKSLKELRIHDGDTLFFEPTISNDFCLLTVKFVEKDKQMSFKWNRTNTTLAMLFTEIIKEFCLETIDRQCLLLTAEFLNQEFDYFQQSNELLDHLGIKDRDSLNLQIVSTDSVRVECAFSTGMKILNVSKNITIENLKNQIDKQFEQYEITELRLFDRMHSTIDLKDSTKTLADFGVQTNQIVYAPVRFENKIKLDSNFINIPIMRSTSIVAKQQLDEVTVVIQNSFEPSTRFQISIESTVQQLLNKLDSSLDQWNISSGSIIIDSSQSNRKLSDLGLESGDIIQVEMKEKPTKRNYQLEKSDFVSTLKIDIPIIYHSTPLGLANLGNTCYMNSALQCLAHAQLLTDFFLTNLTEDSSCDPEWNQFYTVGSVTGAYVDLLKNLWMPKRTFFTSSSFRPTHIKDTIGLQAPRFATFDQQDAQEFMTHLINEIQKEFKEKNPSESMTIIDELFSGNLQSTITCTECQHQTKSMNIINFIPLPLGQHDRPFRVIFISTQGTTDCTDVHVPENGLVRHIIEAYINQQPAFQTFMYLIVAMTNEGQIDIDTPLNQLSNNEITLIEQDQFIGSQAFNATYRTPSKQLTIRHCLQEFCSIEKLDDAWLCQQDTCQKPTNATKQLQLVSLPPILVIQLKRFSQHNDLRYKIETFVDFPIDGLDLTNFLPSSSSQKQDEEYIYDLFAVSNHIGSIYTGHYTAYARHQTGDRYQWYKFDDTFVTQMYSTSSIVSKDAYLLFYVKRNRSKPTTAT